MTFDGNDETRPRKVISSISAVHTQPLRELICELPYAASLDSGHEPHPGHVLRHG